MTWNDTVVSGGNTFVTVDAQIYDPNLHAIGGQITVIPQFQQTPLPRFSGADVFATPDGGFAYAESTISSKLFKPSMPMAQEWRRASDGTAISSSLRGDRPDQRQLCNSNGYFEEFSGCTTSPGTRLSGSTVIAGGNTAHGDIAALPDGRFVIVYDNTGTAAVDAQIYNPDGSTFGNQIAVNNGRD